jgi:hypothetical protein
LATIWRKFKYTTAQAVKDTKKGKMEFQRKPELHFALFFSQYTGAFVDYARDCLVRNTHLPPTQIGLTINRKIWNIKQKKVAFNPDKTFYNVIDNGYNVIDNGRAALASKHQQ